ncbi:arginine/serine-rich protein 1 isoform X1 [Molossus molossus]|uniref:Arginine/serine-rich protein 1 n=1 Tax=Molossus molossus TaxID=27622 RepID=A0A7J8FBV2_MOLMO|nr:arginine/serine-rich protein 1 isoform X1 [Molossus molossus]KAF6445041.1 arginine and serine rich protein 1 [Molossus molossus]
MSNYVNDMWPGSPQESPLASGRSSRLSSETRSRSSRSSRSRSSEASRWSSRSGSRPRRRSRSRSRRRHQRRYRRYSRSYSRSLSRSRSRRRHRERHYCSSRRYYRSPSPDRSRSRSRSRGRSYHRRANAVTRVRRYYGFGRTVYPQEHRSWRGKSRSRSRSPTPFRLSEKDRMELLEIAKANAAKALGTTNFELPPSLRIVPVSKERNGETAVLKNGAKFELSEKLTEDGTKNANEKSSQQKSISLNSSEAKPVLQKSAKATAEETSSGSPKINQKKSPYVLWKPV